MAKHYIIASCVLNTEEGSKHCAVGDVIDLNKKDAETLIKFKKAELYEPKKHDKLIKAAEKAKEPEEVEK